MILGISGKIPTKIDDFPWYKGDVPAMFDYRNFKWLSSGRD
jgi:hypothetical protein